MVIVALTPLPLLPHLLDSAQQSLTHFEVASSIADLLPVVFIITLPLLIGPGGEAGEPKTDSDGGPGIIGVLLIFLGLRILDKRLICKIGRRRLIDIVEVEFF